jgi:microcystin degradation protein MlrC
MRFDLVLPVVVALIMSPLAWEKAKAEPLRIIKTVPEGATLELRIHGTIAQSMSVEPGTYEITVRSLSQDGAVHGRPRRH